MRRRRTSDLEERELETSEVLRIRLGADQTNLMPGATVDASLALLAASDVTIVDVSGAPAEWHPRFREVVILARALRRRVIHRCNLAALLDEDPTELPELLAAHAVDVVASLPQRPSADATTARLVQVLRRFTLAGYGLPGTGLRLDIVVPGAAHREAGVAATLAAQGLRWRGLHLVEMPRPSGGALLGELQRLVDAVAPGELLDLPCRSILEVDWNGTMSLCRDGVTKELGRDVRDPIIAPFVAMTAADAAPTL
jgi:hypothetical protein